MATEIETLLNEMNARGIPGAVIRLDGVPVTSTMALSEMNASLMAAIVNIADAMLKRVDDTQKEAEITFENQTMVLVPVGRHIFCGMARDKESKKTVIEFAARALPLLG